jgi:asparagine synthase (glutamine-hydrolysing)
MCGINGIALSSRSDSSLDQELIMRMRDCLVHRGPDDSGLFLDRNVGLGHRRLSIVDVAAGHQPMTNEDGTLHIVYNGEIYNHADFRDELEAAGHVYRTHCDTETILHLYEQDGEKCVDKLRGMFAFAIWDQRNRKLFIARDRLGVKPLYYVHTADGSLYFASEIKALLSAKAVAPQLNYDSLSDYLANHAPSGEETLFVGVKRLLPGHTLEWQDGRIEIRKYWDISFSPSDSSPQLSDKEYTAQWLEMFRTSVRLRLMADVPLGMFLSGGIDSSAIAALMSGMVSEPVKTFSVAFEEREANELHYARMVAEKFHTDHHEVLVSPQEFFAALPKLIWHEDEPLAHPASVPLYFVSRLAAHHVKVVLTGEGSDEMLAGYYRYRTTVYNLALGKRYNSLVPAALRGLAKSAIDKFPAAAGRKLTRTFLYLKPGLESLYFDNFAVFNQSRQRDLLTEATQSRIGSQNPYAKIHELLSNTDADTLLNQLLYADSKTYLHELLMKQDQMSMAASIESRVPFLDHKLVEFTARLPERMKLRGVTTKYILRESMKGILPEPILTRSKMGFPVPLGTWFRSTFQPIIKEYVLGERALSRGIFNREYVQRLVAEHERGANHSERLWMLVNFEMWQRQFLDGGSTTELTDVAEIASVH